MVWPHSCFRPGQTPEKCPAWRLAFGADWAEWLESGAAGPLTSAEAQTASTRIAISNSSHPHLVGCSHHRTKSGSCCQTSPTGTRTGRRS